MSKDEAIVIHISHIRGSLSRGLFGKSLLVCSIVSLANKD